MAGKIEGAEMCLLDNRLSQRNSKSDDGERSEGSEALQKDRQFNIIFNCKISVICHIVMIAFIFNLV